MVRGFETGEIARNFAGKVADQDFIANYWLESRFCRFFRDRFEGRPLQSLAAPNSCLAFGFRAIDDGTFRCATVFGGQFKGLA